MNKHPFKFAVVLGALIVLSVSGCKSDAASDDQKIQQNNQVIADAMAAESQQIAKLKSENKSTS